MDYLTSISQAIIAVVLINNIGKSIRIYQLKKTESSKIESIGSYEKKSKIKYAFSRFYRKSKID
ncbi:hypothetical protein [Hanstruepera marina]|uniref:hypothetical protein n=1 Tax=Hanstruepera marina TaxID=2873265 RepID=UPI001CA73C4A|nr:hypothetical protein [Hanstruepera marina]